MVHRRSNKQRTAAAAHEVQSCSNNKCCLLGTWLVRVFAYRCEKRMTERSFQFGVVATLLVLGSLVGGGAYMTVSPRGEGTFIERYLNAVWSSWLLLSDPGTAEGSNTWAQKLVSVGVTVIGIFLFAVVVAFVVDWVRDELYALRRGETTVIEYGHTVLLSPTEFSRTVGVIEEIALANLSEGGGVIVVLAPQPKEVSERMIAEMIPKKKLGRTRVVCRSGSGMMPADLRTCAVTMARSIIIFADRELPSDHSDANVVRSVMALRGLEEGLKGFIVAEVRDVDNERLVEMIGEDVRAGAATFWSVFVALSSGVSLTHTIVLALSLSLSLLPPPPFFSPPSPLSRSKRSFRTTLSVD